MTDLTEELSVVELIADRMKKDPKVARIVQDAHIFDDLRQNAGWRRLYDKVAADKGRVMREVAERLMRGRRVSQEEIEFYRGFYLGAVYVLEHPAQAERNLERAAQAAWLIAKDAIEAGEVTPDG